MCNICLNLYSKAWEGVAAALTQKQDETGSSFIFWLNAETWGGRLCER